MDRLRKRADFLAAQRGSRVHSGAFVLQAIARDGAAGPSRLGLTVTRKIGTAVERNRIRRRLRAAARDVAGAAMDAQPAMDPQVPMDYVIVARRAAISVPFAALTAELARALARAPRKGRALSHARNTDDFRSTDRTPDDRPKRAAAAARRAGDDTDVR